MAIEDGIEDRKEKRFLWNRHEIGGSFGDIGTDLPLVMGMILASGMDPASALILFGSFQMLSGFLYGLPMPVQPLKAMAVLVIAQKVPAMTLFGGGLAAGLIMLILTSTNALSLLVRWTPLSVVRGLQFGLGLSLASLALKKYMPAEGVIGWVMVGILFCWMIFMQRSKWKDVIPTALVPVGAGLVYAIVSGVNLSSIVDGAGLQLPTLVVPSKDDVISGFWLLALPQIPLSLSNSIIATERTTEDLFPERSVSARKIGFTYSFMNIVAPFFGGIPVCHGCGGLAGHYAFGARSGTSVLLYGSFFLIVGLFFSSVFDQILHLFPLPLLGLILLFEALALLRFIVELERPQQWTVALLTGVAAVGLPGGFLSAMIVGVGASLWLERK